MKDEYGRKLQCPKCGSKSIYTKTKGKEMQILHCKSCGMEGIIYDFKAVPSSENPSRRDSDLEDPEEPIAKEIVIEGVASNGC